MLSASRPCSSMMPSASATIRSWLSTGRPPRGPRVPLTITPVCRRR